MKRFVLLAVAAVFLVAADDAKNDKGKKDTKGLQGTWIIESVTTDGKAEEDPKGGKIVFKGKDVILTVKERDRKATFTTDAKKKTIAITPTEGPDKDKTLKGIYSLKGDELKICLAKPDKDRPKDFTSEEGSGHTLVVLKRAKDK